MRDQDLLAGHLPMVYRIAMTLTRNEADAKDLAHDAMVSALTSFGRFRSEAKISTWLTAILVNRYRTWRASRKTRARLRPEAEARTRREVPVPEEEAQRTEEHAALWDALGRLDPQERTLVVLSAYQGLDSGAIGEILGRPAGTVRSQLHEAREKLRGFLVEKRSHDERT
jgi:RNA polymerase sigma-70 factor (ECF subfamily)